MVENEGRQGMVVCTSAGKYLKCWECRHAKPHGFTEADFGMRTCRPAGNTELVVSVRCKSVPAISRWEKEKEEAALRRNEVVDSSEVSPEILETLEWVDEMVSEAAGLVKFKPGRHHRFVAPNAEEELAKFKSRKAGRDLLREAEEALGMCADYRYRGAQDSDSFNAEGVTLGEVWAAGRSLKDEPLLKPLALNIWLFFCVLAEEQKNGSVEEQKKVKVDALDQVIHSACQLRQKMKEVNRG
jgi:hypothetical protein